MGKTWVLDTETKGTGAHVVPLEKAKQRIPSDRELATVTFKAPARPSEPSAPPLPLRFKITDVPSARVLAEGVDAHGAIEVLGQMRSGLDARVYVWMSDTNRWRLLTLDEQKTLWRLSREATALSGSRAASGPAGS